MNTVYIPPGCIDPYLKTHRQPGTRFVLGAGIYSTRGAFGFPEYDLCMLAPECSLMGEGPELTTIGLLNPVITHEGKPTQYVEVLTGGARTKGASCGIDISGIRLACDGYLIPTVGLHLWTAKAYVSDVEVDGIYGSRSHPGPVKEGFGILINHAAVPAGYDGGHVISGCHVGLLTVSGENYTTGIFVGCPERPEAPLARSRVSSCAVISTDGHAGYAANDRTTILFCEVLGCRRAVFVDTGPVRHVRIEALDAHRCGWGVDLRGTSERYGITIADSTFAFRTVDGWAQGLLLSDDGSGAEIHGVIVERCKFLAPRDGQSSMARLHGPLVQPYVERDTLWIGGWQPPVLQAGAGKVAAR